MKSSLIILIFIIICNPSLQLMVIKNIKNAFKAIPQQFDIKMTERKTIYFFITSSTQIASSYDIQTANYSTGNWSNLNFVIQSQDENVIRIISCKMERNIEKDFCQWSGNVTIEGVFIGRTEIYACVIDASNSIDLNLQELEKCHIPLAKITVTRRQNLLDSAFKGIVAGFVTILYINFGAALDLTIIKRILLKPIGPAIGFMAQFLIMPLLSFIIGYVLFHDRVDLRLGLFFIGSTPGGGGSNLFTVILKANLNLSVAMTTISNLLAFMMMPLWILTLGSVIFKDGNLVVPYKTIVIMSCSLLLPLCIGILFQKCTPKFAKFLTKILRPFAFIMIIIITVFGFLTNTYLFKLFTWKIILATSALPWLGYIFGWLLARFCCSQSSKDALTIAIETGIQNMAIAMFMLNFSLPQPLADLTSVVPVANILLTPIPLFVYYIIQKLKDIFHTEREQKDGMVCEVTTAMNIF